MIVKKRLKSETKKCPRLVDLLSFVKEKISIWVQMLVGVLSEMHLFIITPVPSSIDLNIVHIMPTPSRATSIMYHISIKFIFITEPRELKLFRNDHFIFEFMEGVVLVIESLEMELS